MPTDQSQSLHELKSAVLKILTGEMTRELNLAWFEEDIPYMAVRYVEELDPDWLMTELAKDCHELDNKLEVVLHLQSSQKAAWLATGYKGTLEDFLHLVDTTKGILSGNP